MQDLSIGIAVEVSDSVDSRLALALAIQAETDGLDLVGVMSTDRHTDALLGFDAWTAASWVLANTHRIGVGIRATAAITGDSPIALPAMAARAEATTDLLANGRLITSESAWVIASPGADLREVTDLTESGWAVVVPINDFDDLHRVAALRESLNDSAVRTRRRSVAAKSRRRAGIDYDAIPPGLQDVTIEPGDSDYRSVASTYLRGGSPGVVIQPRTASEVSDALAFARAHTHLALGIRSAGHGISGRSTNDGGLVIDLRRLGEIEILDERRHLVRIGPGATWKKVAYALDPYGWALGSGDYGGVGVGGLATAGGIGFLSREHGLTIDRLRAVEMVLADGSIVRASPEENAELFWGVRGAGANLGVVTSFDFETYDVGEVGWAQLRFATSDLEQSLLSFSEVVNGTPRDTTVFLVTGRPHGASSAVQLYGLVDASDPDIIKERLIPYLEVGRLVDQHVVVTRYAEVMGRAADVGPDGQQGFGEPVSRSAFLPQMTTEFARDAAELLATGHVYFFQLRSMGGAIADVASDATAFAHRDPAFQVTAMGADREALDAAWNKIVHHFDGLYLSFETDLRAERLERAFPWPVLTRLRRLKRRVDPGNLFRDNFNIDPAEPTAVDSPQATPLRRTA